MAEALDISEGAMDITDSTGEASSDSDNEQTEVPLMILKVGEKLSYTIPSFPVFTVQLRYMKWQYIGDDGILHVKDGAIRDCSSLDRCYPALIMMERSCSNAFFIKVCTFCWRCMCMKIS